MLTVCVESTSLSKQKIAKHQTIGICFEDILKEYFQKELFIWQKTSKSNPCNKIIQVYIRV